MDDNGCTRRRFRGTSWRDGNDATTLAHESTSEPDVGYNTIGFRVLRELKLADLPGLMEA